jgi:hypothetical protein
VKGGWRWGAGRPASRPKTSMAARLDVRRLAREGLLVPGQSVTWRWSNGQTATCAVEADTLRLSYRYEFTNGARDIESRIALTRTPCHLGGSRVWFGCPWCGQRAAILYLWGQPSCRTCARMAYASQSEDAIGRSWRRTHKLQARLTGGTGEWDYRRPKGMRRATFERLRHAYWHEEEVRDMALAAFMARHGMVF